MKIRDVLPDAPKRTLGGARGRQGVFLYWPVGDLRDYDRLREFASSRNETIVGATRALLHAALDLLDEKGES